jgi:imidazolonepropionase-like amidohydrolase
VSAVVESCILRNLALLDVDSASLESGWELLVQDGKILRLERGPIHGVAAETIDLGGRVLMPGLIDCHVHLIRILLPSAPVMLPSLNTAYAAQTLESMLMRGFTTVRDAAGADLGHKQAVELGLFKGPRLFVSGRALSQTGGHGDPRSQADESLPNCLTQLGSGASRIADGITEVRRAVRDEIRRGADQIKIMAGGGVSTLADPLERDQYSVDELRAIVDEAERAGTYAMAHVYTASGIARCVEAGVRTIEHGTFLDESTAKLMRQRGAFYSPTLYAAKLLSEQGLKIGYTASAVEKAKEVFAVGCQGLEIAYRSGLKICFSTDLVRAPELQNEEFLIRADIIPAADLIRSATTVGADVMNMTDKIGSIRLGAFADLIAVDGNPLEDIALLANQGDHISFVMKEGKIVKNRLV